MPLSRAQRRIRPGCQRQRAQARQLCLGGTLADPKLEIFDSSTPARRVLPNAASLACFSGTVRIASKNSMSFGLDAAKPPSM